MKLRISGIVQGVFFRSETRSEARRLGLSGYVRNMPDSTVEAVAEGEQEKIQRFIAWCKHGPPQARVDNVSITDEEPKGGGSGFQVTF